MLKLIRVEYNNGVVKYYNNPTALAKEWGCSAQGITYLLDRIELQGAWVLGRSTLAANNGVKSIERIID